MLNSKLYLFLSYILMFVACTRTATKQENLFYIVSVSSGKCVEVLNSSLKNDERIAVNAFNGNFSQQWILEHVDSNVYFVKSRLSGLVMDCKGGSKDRRTLILQYENKGGDNQKWVFNSKDKEFQIVNYNSSMALELPYSSIDNFVCLIQNSCTDEINQRWKLVPVK